MKHFIIFSMKYFYNFLTRIYSCYIFQSKQFKMEVTVPCFFDFTHNVPEKNPDKHLKKCQKVSKNSIYMYPQFFAIYIYTTVTLYAHKHLIFLSYHRFYYLFCCVCMCYCCVVYIDDLLGLQIYGFLSYNTCFFLIRLI